VASRAQGDERHDPAPLLAAFLDLKGGSDKLASALEKQKVPADVAKLALRHMNAAGRADGPLVTVLSAPRPAFNVKSKGADGRGGQATGRGGASDRATRRAAKRLFRRGDLNCLKCHAIHGAGRRRRPGT